MLKARYNKHPSPPVFTPFLLDAEHPRDDDDYLVVLKCPDGEVGRQSWTSRFVSHYRVSLIYCFYAVNGDAFQYLTFNCK